MTLEKKENIFQDYLKKLIGKTCWSVIAGEGTGSNMTLDFGKKIKRDSPVNNKFLTKEQKNYIGEYSFFILTVWRLDSNKEIICSAFDSNRNDGLMVLGLKKMIGCRVKLIEALPPPYDLIITFEENLQLKVFCVETDSENNLDNYDFFTPEKIFGVETGKPVVITEYKRFGRLCSPYTHGR